MNSACIIAACATSSRNAQENSSDMCTSYFRDTTQVYYKVKLRKYYYFDSMALVTPIESPYYVGSIYAPLKFDVLLDTVNVEPKTLMIEHHFYINTKECSDGIDNYIKDNMSRFTSSGIWELKDQQVINKYLSEINNKYNIELIRDSLDFTTQYCWEVEPYVY